MRNKHQRGMTLVELIIAIVIIGVALAGLAAALSRANTASADPLVEQQMLAIAETLIEEIHLKPFAVQPNAGSGRAGFNDVRDYAGYSSNGIVDVTGAAIPGLESYRVSVAVDNTTLRDVPDPADVLRIRVTVERDNTSLSLTGWRTRPPEESP